MQEKNNYLKSLYFNNINLQLTHDKANDWKYY